MSNVYSDRPNDRARHPGRGVSRESFSGPQESESNSPTLTWASSGVSRPTKNLGWLQRNSAYVTDMEYGPVKGSSSSTGGSLTARGSHPTRGDFTYSVDFGSAKVLREWTGSKRFSHTKITDNLRDGGG